MAFLSEDIKNGEELPQDYFEVSDMELGDEIERIEVFAKDFQLTYSQVLETLKHLENRRKNNLITKIADVVDNRMIELGESLESSLRRISDNIGQL